MANLESESLKSVKVLIADDDESSRLYLSILLEKNAANAIFASSGIEAIESFKKNPDVDVILMDIKMPEINGYDVTRQIRKTNKDVIIIAQTGNALFVDKNEAFQVGCNDYISKPVNAKELIDMIQRHVMSK